MNNHSSHQQLELPGIESRNDKINKINKNKTPKGRGKKPLYRSPLQKNVSARIANKSRLNHIIKLIIEFNAYTEYANKPPVSKQIRTVLNERLEADYHNRRAYIIQSSLKHKTSN